MTSLFFACVKWSLGRPSPPPSRPLVSTWGRYLSRLHRLFSPLGSALGQHFPFLILGRIFSFFIPSIHAEVSATSFFLDIVGADKVDCVLFPPTLRFLSTPTHGRHSMPQGCTPSTIRGGSRLLLKHSLFGRPCTPSPDNIDRQP